MTLAVWSLIRTKSPSLSLVGNWVNIVSYFCMHYFQILGYHLINIVLALTRYFSSLLRYCNCGWSNLLSGRIASIPNIRKNGLSFECSFGKKLYATQGKWLRHHPILFVVLYVLKYRALRK